MTDRRHARSPISSTLSKQDLVSFWGLPRLPSSRRPLRGVLWRGAGLALDTFIAGELGNNPQARWLSIGMQTPPTSKWEFLWKTRRSTAGRSSAIRRNGEQTVRVLTTIGCLAARGLKHLDMLKQAGLVRNRRAAAKPIKAPNRKAWLR